MLLRFELFHTTSKTLLLLRIEMLFYNISEFLVATLWTLSYNIYDFLVATLWTLSYNISDFVVATLWSLSYNISGKKTCLVSDGAPCYPKLSRETKVLHYSCSHSKGIFCLKKRRRDGSTLLVHTGSIDGMWKLAKQAIHNSLNTRINGSVNPKLLQGVRVFQWRWQNNDKNDLMSVTGHALSKRLRSWWMIKKRRALNTFSPVKTNTSLKCTLKIPGIFEQLSDHKIATGPQRQPHRIAKIEQPLARFSPRRVYMWYIYIYIYL